VVVVGFVVGLVAPVVGTFLVMRRYSLMADTLAHISLLGVAIGFLAAMHPVLAAVGIAILAALGMELLRGSRKIFGESVLALFLSGSLAIAVVLLSAGGGLNVDLLGFLFGSITTVQPFDVWVIVPLSCIVFVIVLILYKQFFFIAMNEELAAVGGLPTKTLNAVLVVLAAVTIAISMRIVGALLISALMVIPVITAMQIARSFKGVMVVSVCASLFSVMTGLVLSYHFALASGGTIVVVALVLFSCSLGAQPFMGRKRKLGAL
jgi:zinc transport system permease protein